MSSSLKLSISKSVEFPSSLIFLSPPSLSAFHFGGLPIYPCNRTSILLHLPLNTLPPLDLLLRFAFLLPTAISSSSISSLVWRLFQLPGFSSLQFQPSLQEITQGVRSSTKAVRLAEERLRGFQDIAPPAASLQMVASQKSKTAEPVVARNARAIREGIVKGRGVVQLFFTLIRFSMMAASYFKRRAKRQKV